MEGGLDHVKTPLLSPEGEKPIIHNGRVQKSNSVASLKCDFFSKLPEKVLSGLDSEAPFHLDLSKATGMIEGIIKRVYVSVSHCFLYILFLELYI